jgi:diphthamide synthase (EF-2-diphthine--ammonia ligase)
MSRCAISWSAGKDSWLALTRAREQGLVVDTFVTMCDEDGEFHTFVTGGPGFAAPLQVVDGPQRRVASQPPFSPTEFVFQALLPATAIPRA